MAATEPPLPTAFRRLTPIPLSGILRSMTVGFIETELFTASAAFLSDDELRVAQAEIAANPRRATW